MFSKERTSIEDHPRIRGEHCLSPRRNPELVGSSPHTRGTPVLAVSGCAWPRIIPAYVGNTFTDRTNCHGYPDHPRIRGEHVDEMEFRGYSEGSSPHTRGTPKLFTGTSAGSRIIPAYAGNTFRVWTDEERA